MKLHGSHLAFLLVGLAGGYAIAAWGPAEYSYTPQLTLLRRRLHEQVQARAAAQEATATWRRTVDTQRTAFVAAMREATAAHQQRAQWLAGKNRTLLDSLAGLARARGDTSQARQLAAASAGVQEQDAACALAITSCQQAQDSLRVQVTDRDSIIADRDTSLMRADSLAADAVADDSANVVRANRAERKTKVVTVVGVLLIVLSLFR